MIELVKVLLYAPSNLLFHIDDFTVFCKLDCNMGMCTKFALLLSPKFYGREEMKRNYNTIFLSHAKIVRSVLIISRSYNILTYTRLQK